MDWTLAISRNHEALKRILLALIAMAGLTDGRIGAALSRPLYRALLRILRPTEAAVRRLIFIAAYGLIVTARPSKPFPHKSFSKATTPRAHVFRLIDPLKSFPSAARTPISVSPPRISVPGVIDPIFLAPEPRATHINAKNIERRLNALSRALASLPSEAKRLARWLAKRNAALQAMRRSPIRLSPFRPGRPPGYRTKHTHEIHPILKECHALMRDRIAQVDTT